MFISVKCQSLTKIHYNQALPSLPTDRLSALTDSVGAAVANAIDDAIAACSDADADYSATIDGYIANS
jgi:hypothetical protein